MFEIFIILILISLNGFLAMSEIALVSTKSYKLENKAKDGNKSAQKALSLLEEPERFLSAIQIGISLIGILSGAFGGYTMAEDLTPYLKEIDIIAPYAAEVSFALIVILITYLSLVIGELVPKTFALNNPEKITLSVSPFIYLVTKIFAPFVGVLSASTKVVLFLTRIKKSKEPPVTEEELKSLLELGKTHGTVEKEEFDMIKKIFSFNDKKVNSVMIPRTEIEWINSEMSNQEIFQFISSHNFSRYFVCNESIDDVLGSIDSKDFLIRYQIDPSFNIKNILNDALVIPESIYSVDLLEKFRSRKTNLALVIDEYGGTQGMVTLHDLIENIFGDLPEKHETSEQSIIQRKDGTFLVDGSTDTVVVSDFFSIDINSTDYSTLNGFLMHSLGKVPQEGDTVDHQNLQFEVIDIDGRRVDKVLVKKIPNESN